MIRLLFSSRTLMNKKYGISNLDKINKYSLIIIHSNKPFKGFLLLLISLFY